MARGALFPYDGAARRGDNRRLSIALGVSLFVHAIAIASLRGILPMTHAYSQGAAFSGLGLQAILAGPAREPAPEEPTSAETAIATSLLSPPAAHPIETSPQGPPPMTAPRPGSGSSVRGSSSPMVRMAVGLIGDPARLGPDYVARLAQRFPERVSKTPQLLGTPVMTYPAAAFAAGAQQRIAALLTLDANGAIVETQLFPDDPMFSPDVHDALKNARFAPAEIDTRTVPYWAIVEFFFSLEQPSAAPPKPSGRAASSARQPRVGR
jgi:hypothetical protein